MWPFLLLVTLIIRMMEKGQNEENRVTKKKCRL